MTRVIDLDRTFSPGSGDVRELGLRVPRLRRTEVIPGLLAASGFGVTAGWAVTRQKARRGTATRRSVTCRYTFRGRRTPPKARTVLNLDRIRQRMLG
jgi:hypothetical protein